MISISTAKLFSTEGRDIVSQNPSYTCVFLVILRVMCAALRGSTIPVLNPSKTAHAALTNTLAIAPRHAQQHGRGLSGKGGAKSKLGCLKQDNCAVDS